MATKQLVKVEVNRTELMHSVWSILEEYHVEAADKIIAFGTALVKIGETLKGVPVEEAQRIIRSAAALHGIEV